MSATQRRFIVYDEHATTPSHLINSRALFGRWWVVDTANRNTLIDQFHSKRAAQACARDLNRTPKDGAQ